MLLVDMFVVDEELSSSEIDLNRSPFLVLLVGCKGKMSSILTLMVWAVSTIFDSSGRGLKGLAIV